MSRRPPTRRDKYGRLVLEPDPAETPTETPPDTTEATSSATTSKKRLSVLEKRILEFTKGTDEGYKALQDQVCQAASETIERASPSSRKHYDNAKRAFETCATTLARPEIIEDFWDVNVVRKYAPQYIMFRVHMTEGRQGERVKAITVVGWFSHIVVVICKFTHDENGKKCGGALLYTEGLAEVIEIQVHTGKSVKKYGLIRHITTRGHSFGIPEVERCMEVMLRSSQSRGREVRIQESAMLVMHLATGVRPSGMLASEQEYAGYNQFMKAGDLTVNNRGGTHWDVEVRIMNHKGWNTTALGRMITYTITARKSIKNALIDPWWIVLHLWLQGALGDYKASQPRDHCTGRSFVV
ncbi:hypothetical protein FRC07_004134 [Ceratobasidium sp. 392]|nr:hypothetical protein FRC07_004134 [Ceratobasidium sp. 392]